MRNDLHPVIVDSRSGSRINIEDWNLDNAIERIESDNCPICEQVKPSREPFKRDMADGSERGDIE